MGSGVDRLLELGAAADVAKADRILQLTSRKDKRVASPITPASRMKSPNTNPMVSPKVAAQGIREYKER